MAMCMSASDLILPSGQRTGIVPFPSILLLHNNTLYHSFTSTPTRGMAVALLDLRGEVFWGFGTRFTEDYQ